MLKSVIDWNTSGFIQRHTHTIQVRKMKKKNPKKESLLDCWTTCCYYWLPLLVPLPWRKHIKAKASGGGGSGEATTTYFVCYNSFLVNCVAKRKLKCKLLRPCLWCKSRRNDCVMVVERAYKEAWFSF